MKILMLTSELDIGGAETHIETLCLSLAKRSHEVCALSGGGRTSERMKKRGIRQILIGKHSKDPISFLKTQRTLYKIIKEEKPDIVHAHSRMIALIASFACRRAGVPFVTTAHAMFSMTPMKALLSRWGEETVAVSEDIKAHLVKAGGVPPERITVIENGVFVPRELKMKAKKGHNILFVSRMDKDCSLGARLLCEIAPALAKKYPDVHITLVGGGNDLENIIKKAERANEVIGRKTVDIKGAVQEPAVFFENTDIFVGVSRAALEAMSCVIPVILLGNEGFSGLLSEKNMTAALKTNFCAREGSAPESRDLFAALDEFFSLTDEEKTAISSFCRETVKKYCSAEQMAKKTLAFYEKVIKDHNKRSKKSLPPAAPSRGAEQGKKTRKKRILLCGYYGFGNLGDDTILASILNALSAERERVEICVLGSKKLTKPRQMSNSTVSRVSFWKENSKKNAEKVTKATKTTKSKRLLPDFCRCVPLLSPLSAVREMKRSDIFVFGGGSLLQNKTSNRSLAYYLFLITLAKKYCKKTVMLSNGIGPITDERYRRASLAAINAFDVITVRDTQSLEFLKGALPRRKISLFPDPALLLVGDGDERRAKPPFSQGGEMRETKRPLRKKTSDSFLICPTASEAGWQCAGESAFFDELSQNMPANAYASSDSTVSRVRSSLPFSRKFAVCLCSGELKRCGISPLDAAKALRQVSEAFSAEPYFIVMNKRADLDITNAVARLLGRKASVFCPDDASELLSLLSLSEFSVCMRFHATLFSVCSGVPTLAIGTDRKMSAFCSDLDAFPTCAPAVLSNGKQLVSALRQMLSHFEKNGENVRSNAQKMRSLCSKRFKQLINYLNTLDFGL